MKKKLAMLLAMCLVAGTLNGTTGMPIVMAAGEQQKINSNNDYTYSYTSWSGSINITGYTGQETELVIPSEINGKTVTSIGSYTF